MFLHPSALRLEQYADRELGAREQARLARHLESCSRCREHVSETRALAARARVMTVEPHSDDLLDRIQQRYLSGPAVLLPADAPVVRRPRASLLQAAVLLLVVGATAVGLQLVGAANVIAVEAHGLLTIAPASPRRGDVVTLTYRSELFPKSETLVVRWRPRFASTGRRTVRVDTYDMAKLVRRRDGAWEARVRLPDSVVYAALAVEQVGGAAVDNNGGKLWELLVASQDGRPEFAGLVQQMKDLEDRNWVASLATARRMTELYPDRTLSWMHYWALQDYVRGARTTDSTRAVDVARLRLLDDTLSAMQRVPADEMDGIFFFASLLGEQSIAAKWKQRLLAEAPRHPTAVEQRTSDLLRSTPGNAEALLDQLEQMPVTEGHLPTNYLQLGYSAAVQTGNPKRMTAWAERWASNQPWNATAVWEPLLDSAQTRGIAMAHLEQRMQSLGRAPEHEREVGRTAMEQRRVLLAETRRIQGALGRALVSSGRPTAALTMLDSAVTGVWRTDLFRAAAQARLQAGDTTGTVELLARIAVDPGISARQRDSVQREANSLGARDRWPMLTQAAVQLMRTITFESALRFRVRPIAVSGANGKDTTLQAHQEKGKPTVVVFWSRHCGPALMATPAIAALSKRLSESGEAKMVIVVDEPISAELTADIAKRGVIATVISDDRGEASQALAAPGTPTYVVLDRKGQLRFRHRDLTAIPRQLDALAASASASN